MSENNQIVKKEFCGCSFIMEQSKKFESDLKIVSDILNKETITEDDRKTLLNIYKVAYHESGKIEGICSCDSSATNCKFCQEMRKAAENNPAHICGMCYDYAQEQFKLNAVNRHSLNMLIMSSVEFTIDELRVLPITELSRINSSGDTPNVIYAKNMLRIAYAHEYTKCGYWAKNTAAVVAACDEIGKPSNVKLIQSSPIIGKTAKLAPYFDYTFTVCATKETVAEALKNGGKECNGKKCRDCGYKCYYGTWEQGSNIVEYLRGVDKKTRKAIEDYNKNN